jgi:protein-tyrosine kinase
VLGVQRERGLSDALQRARLDVESLIFNTEVPNLQILPAGAPSARAAELIASSRMREIAARLINRSPRRVVLFDSSPLLVSGEARALLQIAGQVVLIARAGRTPRQALLDAVNYVDKAKLSGLVLNDESALPTGGYYGYPAYGSASGEASGAIYSRDSRPTDIRSAM